MYDKGRSAIQTMLWSIVVALMTAFEMWADILENNIEYNVIIFLR